MTEEARVERTEHGLEPTGEGWFVVNARDVRWGHTEQMGSFCDFEGEADFSQVGVNIHVLRPGEPNALYHAEDAQENFLVVAGECILVIEGEERRLGPWDFVHCPPGTAHVRVGAGEGPCVIVMVGARKPGRWIRYFADPAAARYGAAVEKETDSAQEAYAAFASPEWGSFREGDLPG